MCPEVLCGQMWT